MNASAQNLVRLTGEITALEPLRHTPAGLPVMSFRLRHRSVQVEANIERQTEFEAAAMAIGEVAEAVSKFHPGDNVAVQGFLAARRRSGVAMRAQIATQFVFHITHITHLTH